MKRPLKTIGVGGAKIRMEVEPGHPVVEGVLKAIKDHGGTAPEGVKRITILPGKT
jgi:hypothetical protein